MYRVYQRKPRGTSESWQYKPLGPAPDIWMRLEKSEKTGGLERATGFERKRPGVRRVYSEAKRIKESLWHMPGNGRGFSSSEFGALSKLGERVFMASRAGPGRGLRFVWPLALPLLAVSAASGEVGRAAEERVKERAGNIFEMILGEQLSVDFDPEPVVELRDVNAVFRIRGMGLV